MGKAFAGMVFPDVAPLAVTDDHVSRVHMFDVPSPLRVHACTFLDGQAADGQWWTVGEFRYEGEDYGTAFARRVLRDGRVTVDYGIEAE